MTVAYMNLVRAALDSGDFRLLYKTLDVLRTKHPDVYRNWKHLESMMPVEY